MRLFKQIVQQNDQYKEANLFSNRREHENSIKNVETIVKMSVSKSMRNMNLTESTSIVEEAQNFQIEFEPINLTLLENAAQNDNNADDFKNITDDIDEYSIEIQEEISRTNEYLKTSTITILPNVETEQEPDISEIVFDESIEYENNFQPTNDFSIKLGTHEIPRFSCASHKNNIAVRMAIRKSSQVII